MSRKNLTSSIGPIMQLAFVPEDFDAAIEYWTRTMGVGPFFWIEKAGLQNMRFEGKDSDVDFGLALSYWGDVQIELIKQHNDSPSIYNSKPYATSGLHHVCLMTEDIKKSKQIALDAGGKMAFEADVPGGGGVFYADFGGPEGLIEVLQAAPGSEGLFEVLKAAAADWDDKEQFLFLG